MPQLPAAALPTASAAARLAALARPRMWPALMVISLFGYGLGHWTLAAPLHAPLAMLRLMAAWTALHIGTLWWNAARDHDESSVLFGDPVVPPAGTGALGLGMLGLCCLVAWPAGPVPAACAAAAALLALAYSHPRLAWKGHPLLGPLVNIVGYGVLTPLASYSLVGRLDDPRLALALLGCGGAMGSLCFAAMVWQGPEDARRGDRTLVVTAGPRGALRAARIALGIAALPVLIGALVGFFPRAVLLCFALLPWADAPLRAWLRAAAPGDPRRGPARAQAYLGRLTLLAGAALLCAFADYLRDDLAGRPLAGRGTALTPALEP